MDFFMEERFYGKDAESDETKKERMGIIFSDDRGLGHGIYTDLARPDDYGIKEALTKH